MRQPVGTELIASSHVSHQRRRPSPQCVDDVAQPLTPRRQRIGGFVPDDDPALLQRSQPLNKEVGGDPGQTIEKLVVSPRPLEELSDDQQNPPVSHNVKAAG